MILDIFSNPGWILQTEGENLNRKLSGPGSHPFHRDSLWYQPDVVDSDPEAATTRVLTGHPELERLITGGGKDH